MPIAVLVLAAGLAAEAFAVQVPPNFSGKWVGGRPAANLVGVVGPREMTITQDSSTISIERPYGRKRVTVKLNLDGTASKNVLDPGGSRLGAASTPRELTSRVSWENGRLKIITEYLPGGAARKVVTIEVLFLEAGNLIVERSDEGIGAFNAPLRGGELKASKDVYRRTEK